MRLQNITILLYLIVTLINLWAGYANHETLILISKPLLMPILALWFYLETTKHSSLFRKLILAALFFSWGGDTFLMFVESKGEQFFLLGLGSFLITHLLYTTAFLKTVSWNKGFLSKHKWVPLPFLIFFSGFLAFLLPDVAPQMKIPVAVYSLVIISMVLAAFNWNTIESQNTFLLIFFGALIFMCSDAIIALNKFKSPIPQAHFWIMSLYLLGQYLIVRGGIKMLSGKDG